MSCMKIESLPRLEFAHTFRATDYQTYLWSVKNRFEISYVLAGNVQLIQNGKEYCATAGDFICNTKTIPVAVYSAGFTEYLAASFVMQYSDCKLPLVLRTSAIKSHCPLLMNEIVRMHILYPNRVYSTAGLFLQLLDELERIHLQSASSCSHSPYIQKARDYIYEHIHEPIRQTDIAAHLGITPEYLCSIFKQSEGISLMPFINRVKLENMRMLIENKELTLQQAASMYGYSDPNYVSRLYKKMFGQNITTALRSNKYR